MAPPTPPNAPPAEEKPDANGLSRRFSQTSGGYEKKEGVGPQTRERSKEKKSPGPVKPMFADAEAMKEKLRQNMQKPQYDVSNYYYKTGLFRSIATHCIFERATLTVILLNALYLMFDTDYNHAGMLLKAKAIFQLSEHFFCIYFTLEWFVRFMSFKRKRNCVKDAWFVFDSFMVTLMVGETWVMTFAFIFAGGGASMGNTDIMKLFRLMRLSRMARMAKLLRAMPELLILIKGMVSAMRSVCFTLLLQFIIIYIFGITFVQLTEDMPAVRKDFNTVPRSMHTLLVQGTLMDNIGEIVSKLETESLVLVTLFYTFVLISALTVMNMLIGVLCEVVSAVASTEKEELTVSYVKARLREILRQGGLDQDGDGMISKVEFAQILENPQAARILTEVGVDVFGLVELSDFIFEKEDEDGAKIEGQLTFGDFMEVVLQLRGTNVATVKDIVDLRKFMSATSKTLEHKLKIIEDKFLAARGESRDTHSKCNYGGVPATSSYKVIADSCVSNGMEESPVSKTCPKDDLGLVSHQEVHQIDPIDEPPFIPHETEAGPASLQLPTLPLKTAANGSGHSSQMFQTAVAYSKPSDFAAASKVSAVEAAMADLRLAMAPAVSAKLANSASGLCGVRLELDRLRQHVDEELQLIAKDIARKAEGFTVATPKLDPTLVRHEDFPEGPKLLQSSGTVAMSPGAEMGSKREVVVIAGSAAEHGTYRLDAG